MDRIRRDTLLGLVFFGTMAFLLWATVNLTDLSLGKVPALTVFFEDAGSARAGTDVMVLGKKIGKVGAIDVLYDRPELPVRMTLLLKEAVPLTDRMSIDVRDAGVLGGKMIYIDPGRGAPLLANSELRGRSQKSALDRIGDVADGKGELGQAIADALKAFRATFDNMNNEETSIGRVLRRRELYDEVLQTVQKLNGIFDSIQKGEGTIGRLIVDGKIGNDVTRIVTNLAAVSDTLRGSEGTFGLLLNDRGTAENLRSVVEKVASLVSDTHAGKGALGRIFRDEKLATDFTDAVANLSTLLQKANDPQAGVLGVLTSDKETAANVKVMFANLRDVTDSLTRSEGMLGVLLNDKDLGVRFRRIMTQVSRALEDAREAAPIGNFIQVLLGAF